MKDLNDFKYEKNKFKYFSFVAYLAYVSFLEDITLVSWIILKVFSWRRQYLLNLVEKCKNSNCQTVLYFYFFLIAKWTEFRISIEVVNQAFQTMIDLLFFLFIPFTFFDMFYGINKTLIFLQRFHKMRLKNKTATMILIFYLDGEE